MRQEVRFVLAIALMILVLITTNILFPPIPLEEGIGPAGDAPGQLDSSGGAGAPSIPLGGPDTATGATADGPDVVAGPPRTAPSPFDRPEDVAVEASEDTVVVDGSLYRFVWSTKGARLISAQLLQFRSFATRTQGDSRYSASAERGDPSDRRACRLGRDGPRFYWRRDTHSSAFGNVRSIRSRA